MQPRCTTVLNHRDKYLLHLLLILVTQPLEHVDHIVHTKLTLHLVLPRPHVDSVVLYFRLATHKYEIVLSNLSVRDLLLESVLGEVDIGIESLVVEPITYSLAIIIPIGVYR